MAIPEHVPWQATGHTLGNGGQGQVHLVIKTDEPDGPEFALKELRNSAGLQARQRFQREIEAVKSLSAPSIVRIVDYSKEDQDYQFYVMEYHKGARDLEKIIFSDSNPYHGNVEASLALFEEIVSAIGVCESSDPLIVHRDINPKNILILPDETVCLIDFGICQIQDGGIVTLTDENVGSRNYTAPECEYGRDAVVGVHSDIYSAAKVLWSAITSRRAFAREEPVFSDQSMEKMFPANKDTWHLMDVFEKTIRGQIEDRCRTTAEVLEHVAEVKYLVRRGFPPLKDILSRCPSCGANSIRGGQNTHPGGAGFQIFGNVPPGFASRVCERCGFAFVRGINVWNTNVQRLEGLS